MADFSISLSSSDKWYFKDSWISGVSAVATNSTDSPKVLSKITLQCTVACSGGQYFTVPSGETTIQKQASGAGGIMVCNISQNSTQVTSSSPCTIPPVTSANFHPLSNLSSPTNCMFTPNPGNTYVFNINKPITVASGQSVTLIFKISSWYGASFAGDPCIQISSVDKIVDIPVNYFTVTYNLDGGTRTGGGQLSQSVAENTISTPPTCTKSGYVLTGWTTSSPTYPYITGTTTCKAIWTPGNVWVYDGTKWVKSKVAKTYTGSTWIASELHKY